MTTFRSQNGTALIAVLGLTMVLLPLGVLAVLQTHIDALVAHHMRNEVQTFYTAEAGLQHAIAEIVPSTSFIPLLRGSDDIAGTADDGTFPFIGGPPAEFPSRAFRYQVRVALRHSDLLELTSEAQGPHGASKSVKALVARLPVPYTPAALFVEADARRLNLGRDVLIAGDDHRIGDEPGHASGREPSVAALGTVQADDVGALRQQFGADAGYRLVGAGAAPSIAATNGLGIAALAQRVMAQAAAVTLPGTDIDSAIWGTSEAPQVTVVDGPLGVHGVLRGRGVLVLTDAVKVSGSLRFEGLVFALGSLIFMPGSEVVIRGTLWRAISQDERLDVLGHGAILYSSSALVMADRLVPSVLPRAVRVVGWQEDL